MSESDTMTRFEVIFEAEGVNAHNFRNDVTVHKHPPHPVTVELPTDDGPKHGGDGTAPYPLAYFASGLTACTMTQLRAFSKRLGVAIGTVRVKTRCHWQGEQRGGAPYESTPIAFTMDIDLGSDAPESDQRRLVAAAQKGCFVEQSLKPGLVTHRLKIGERWIAV